MAEYGDAGGWETGGGGGGGVGCDEGGMDPDGYR